MGDTPATQPTPEGAPLEEVRLRRAELRADMTGLEVATAGPYLGRVGQWAAEVEARLAVVADDFAEHLEITEGPGGLHESLVESAPRLASGVARLVRDHAAIRTALEEADRTLAAAAAPGAADEAVGPAREAVTAVLLLLARHRQRGSDLVWEAFTYDVGGET